MVEEQEEQKSEVIRTAQRYEPAEPVEPPVAQLEAPPIVARTPYEIISERVKIDVSKMIERALKPEEEEEDEFDAIIRLYMKLAKVKLIMQLPQFLTELFTPKEKEDEVLAPILKDIEKKAKEKVSKLVLEDIFKGEKEKTLEEEIKDTIKPLLTFFKVQANRMLTPTSFKEGKTKIVVTDQQGG
jgi:predicted transcriptional regulator